MKTLMQANAERLDVLEENFSTLLDECVTLAENQRAMQQQLEALVRYAGGILGPRTEKSE